MRAVASNTDSGKLVGIPTGRMLTCRGAWPARSAALGGIVVAGSHGNVNTS